MRVKQVSSTGFTASSEYMVMKLMSISLDIVLVLSQTNILQDAQAVRIDLRLGVFNFVLTRDFVDKFNLEFDSFIWHNYSLANFSMIYEDHYWYNLGYFIDLSWSTWVTSSDPFRLVVMNGLNSFNDLKYRTEHVVLLVMPAN